MAKPQRFRDDAPHLSSLVTSDPGFPPLAADPDAARREIHSWYYRIYPPSSLLIGGACFDWPGPEYDTVITTPDHRHPRSKGFVP